MTDSEIAARATAAYIRQRAAMPPVYGASPREERRRQRQFRVAYQDDMKGQFRINWWTVAAAVVLGALGGPAGVVLAIAATVFEWLLERDLEKSFGNGAFEAAAVAMGA